MSPPQESPGARGHLRWPWGQLAIGLLVSALGASGEPLLAAAQVSSPGRSSGPRLVIKNPVADYGRVPFDQMVRHVFSLRNAGSEPLRILNSFCHDKAMRTIAIEGC